MGPSGPVSAPMVIEIDHENMSKDLEALDIKIPVLMPRIMRDLKRLE